MSSKGLLRPLGLAFRAAVGRKTQCELRVILKRRQELSGFSDGELKSAAHNLRGCPEVIELFALTAEVAARALGLQMFDVQLEVRSPCSAGTSQRCRLEKERRWRLCRQSSGTHARAAVFTY